MWLILEPTGRNKKTTKYGQDSACFKLRLKTRINKDIIISSGCPGFFRSFSEDKGFDVYH
ncbi:hypothetical protein OA42_02415 [Klebsiella michiganensis]|nr:hypothetical protein OA42_02415 [Klebsiella michiganensis]